MRITIRNLLASVVLSVTASVAFAQGAAPAAKPQVESVNILEVTKDVKLKEMLQRINLVAISLFGKM